MNIIIKNAAKVAEADILLDGLTVIAGFNNMGKSTILKSAYLVLKTFRDFKQKVWKVRKRSLKSLLLRQEYYFDSNGSVYLPREFLSALAEDADKILSVCISEQKNSYELFKNIFLKNLKTYRRYLPKQVSSDFISDEFIRKFYERIRTISTRDEGIELKYIAEMYIRNVFGGQLNHFMYQSQTSVLVRSETEQYQMFVEDNRISQMEYDLYAEADVFYLPPYHLLDSLERSKMSHRVYSPEYDIRSALAPGKTEPTLEEYQEIERNTTMVKEILKEVLHGRLERSLSGNILFKDDESDEAVNIGNVASGMKNLLIIQSLTESGKLKRNGILMVDEPETNLHPQWHLKFAEVLVMLYKYMGVRSVISTHSPYFIKALETKLAEEQRKETGHYYVMEQADKNLYRTQDVTGHTEKIYEMLYCPLEYI